MSTRRRRQSRRGALACTAAALLGGFGLLAGATPASAATPTTSDVVLNDSFARILALPHVAHLGTLAPATLLTVGAWIPGNTAGLEAYARAVSDVKSPLYGQSLTPAQVDQRFGVSQLVSLATQKALEIHGLKPVYVSNDGQYVELSGSAAQVEQTFKVTLDAVEVAGKDYFANTTGATVPSTVGAVIGLTDFSDMTTDATTEGSQDMCDEIVPGACVGTTTGQDLAGVYDAPSSAGDTYNPSDTSTDYGQGQRIAIFGEGNVNDVVTALRTAEDATNLNPLGTGDLGKVVLPHVPVREVLVNDPQISTADTSGEDEFDLDSQSSTEMSPLLSEIDFYFGQTLSDQSIAGTYSAWVNDPDGPAIGNSSFGGCEALEQLSGGEATDDALLAEGVAEGRSMFVSTGDAGAGGCQLLVNAGQPGAPGVEDPASSDFVTAVGGTEIYSDSTGHDTQAQPPTRNREFGWYDSTGGYASFSPMPSDQAAVLTSPADTTLPINEPCAIPAGSTCREVPDVSSMSGDEFTDAFDVVICTGGQANCKDEGVLGTSLASPTWAGMWARVAAAHKTKAQRQEAQLTCSAVAATSQDSLGFARPDLYQLAANPALDAKDFFDVGGLAPTATNPTANYIYPTLPRSPADPTGYDLVTGLGTPDVKQIIDDLDCNDTPAAPVAAPSDTPTVVDAATIATYNCPNGYVAHDPTGDATPSADPGVDLTSSTITGSVTGVTFKITTAGAPLSPATDDSFVVVFGNGGTLYGVDVDPAGGPGYGEVGATPTPGTAAFRLISFSIVEGALFVPEYVTSLTGTSDPSTGTYTIDLPYATFNKAEASTVGFTPLSQSANLDPVEVLSGTQPGFAATAGQQVSSDTLQYPCAQLLGATGGAPPPSVPETGVPAVMVVLGLAGSGWLVLRRGRRHAPAA